MPSSVTFQPQIIILLLSYSTHTSVWLFLSCSHLLLWRRNCVLFHQVLSYLVKMQLNLRLWGYFLVSLFWIVSCFDLLEMGSHCIANADVRLTILPPGHLECQHCSCTRGSAHTFYCKLYPLWDRKSVLFPRKLSSSLGRSQHLCPICTLLWKSHWAWHRPSREDKCFTEECGKFQGQYT